MFKINDEGVLNLLSFVIGKKPLSDFGYIDNACSQTTKALTDTTRRLFVSNIRMHQQYGRYRKKHGRVKKTLVEHGGLGDGSKRQLLELSLDSDG